MISLIKSDGSNLSSLHHMTCFSSHVHVRIHFTNASGAIWAGMVTTATNEHLPLAGVGAHGVEAGESWTAGLAQTHALIHICRTIHKACGDRVREDSDTEQEERTRGKER